MKQSKTKSQIALETNKKVIEYIENLQKTKSQQVFTKAEIIMAMKDQEDFFGKEIYSKLREKLGLGKRQ
jgi:hypothetical protein